MPNRLPLDFWGRQSVLSVMNRVTSISQHSVSSLTSVHFSALCTSCSVLALNVFYPVQDQLVFKDISKTHMQVSGNSADSQHPGVWSLLHKFSHFCSPKLWSLPRKSQNSGVCLPSICLRDSQENALGQKAMVNLELITCGFLLSRITVLHCLFTSFWKQFLYFFHFYSCVY